MATISGVLLEERMLDLIVSLLIEVDDVYPLALLSSALHAVYESLFVEEEPVRLGYRQYKSTKDLPL